MELFIVVSYQQNQIKAKAARKALRDLWENKIHQFMNFQSHYHLIETQNMV